MRTILPIIITWFFFSLAHGQQTSRPGHLDVVYLKNGSIFKGWIKSYQPQDNLVIQILGDSLFLTIPSGEIRKIVQEQEKAGASTYTFEKPRTYSFREKGLYVSASLYLMPGKYSGGTSLGAGLSGSVGYQWNRYAGTGLFVGSEYFYSNSEHVIVPIGAEFRGYALKSRFSPYYAVQCGYGFAQKDPSALISAARGGLFLHPAIGYRFGASSGINFIADIGVKWQQATYTHSIPNWDNSVSSYDEKWSYQRIVFRFGIVF